MHKFMVIHMASFMNSFHFSLSAFLLSAKSNVTVSVSLGIVLCSKKMMHTR